MINHLYIHIPFCESKCPYCAFESNVYNKNLHTSYIDALIKTLPNHNVETVYIGGGTPSALDANLYFNILNKYKNAQEITIEANPNSATSAWLNNIASYGANRISFGVQSLRDDKLKLLGRKHDANNARQAVLNAYRAGFNRISIDLIYDTVLDSTQSIIKELEEAMLLPIDHISMYSLTLEENTPFYKRSDIRLQNDEIAYAVANKLNNSGFTQYEAASFGKTKSIHNASYWKGANYYGCGYGSVGFNGIQRYNTKATTIQEYINNPSEVIFENIDEKDRCFELIFLGLRSFIGISDSILSNKQLQKAILLSDNGKLEYKNKIFYNTNYWLADEITIFITQ